MQLYRAIKIIQKTEPAMGRTEFYSYDVGEIVSIVDSHAEDGASFQLSIGSAKYLIRNGFAEYYNPVAVEQAPPATRSQIDDAVARYEHDLALLDGESELRERWAAAEAEADRVYVMMSQSNEICLEQQIEYLSDQDNEYARDKFHGASVELLTHYRAWRKANDVLRQIRGEWEAHTNACVAMRREELEMRLTLARELTPAPEPFTELEYLTAEGLYEKGAEYGMPRWEYLDPAAREFWLVKARAEMKSRRR